MKNSYCAFIGHRSIDLPWQCDESDPQCVKLQMELTSQIVKLVNRGVTNFFSSMIGETDCYFAKIVLMLRKKNPALLLHCILPCEGQADKWSISAQKKYYETLTKANFVNYISRKYYNGCIMECNRCLVEQTDILFAVYNGKKKGIIRGTINYAQKMGREIIIIDPITQHIFHQFKK